MELAKSVQGVVVTHAVVKTSAFHPRRSRVCFIHVTRVWQRFSGHIDYLP